MGIADLVSRVLGGAPVAVEAYDGTSTAPPDAVAKIFVRSPDALRRFITAPNDLGLGRAYVAGDLDVDGDLFAALESVSHTDLDVDRSLLVDVAKQVGWEGLRPLPPPPEEARMHGPRHCASATRRPSPTTTTCPTTSTG